MFSTERNCECNIKRYRDRKMMQRWLASVLLYCEKRFYRVRRYASIGEITAIIDRDKTGNTAIKVAP